MKKILILGFTLLNLYACKAQILPLENLINYIDEGEGIPEGTTYIKDVNNLLDQYVGTWSGSYDNKNYTFIIVPYTDVRHNGQLSEDILRVYYKITTANGTIIEDTTSFMTGLVPQNEEYLIINGYYIESNYYVLTYVGRDGNCGQAGDVFISAGWDNNPNKMKLSMEPESDMVPGGCDEITHIIPTEQITLLKQ